jgi:Glyoxalase-like domain
VIRLDHILWAAPNLDEGERLFERLTGVAPVRGGIHPGFGTRNSLAGLDGGAYFEIIAPDPAQDLAGNRGGRIAALARPGLLTFAVASNALDALKAAALEEGLTVRGPETMHRVTPSGGRLDWSILYLEHAVFGEAVPFVIDWDGTPHPSLSTPQGCRLKSFASVHPDAEGLSSLYARLGVPVTVKRAIDAGFFAELATPRGDVVLGYA